ncbi:SLA1 Homology Domain 1 (SHD1) protein [Prosthecobacter fusiformis]|uniref:SLA1 Homology Domain 1 (SHD1) protein n=1 Tax=Prosthecobacter fusiformis TaxID=48464 RepID=A0A4R7SRP7_9BACT|nr:hypothetical protein [Prosthecobacter fusiformis]TDU80837.1 SLA1 Homology Domain 1 (SHD1) protein [Prosthecobacter fusiformis]
MQKIVICLYLASFCLPALAQTAQRAWTDETGRQVQAEYAGMQGDSVLLRLAPDKTVPFPLARLSPADQDYVKAQSAVPATAAPTISSDPARKPIEERTWPGNVEVPARSIEIKAIHESVAERTYVYQSEAFEFTSQAKLAGSVMKEVARTFEATRSLVEALPWGIVCRPPDGMPRFKAALYESRQDYIDAGGPENSGGVYNTGDKIFKIPFPSLGMEKRGQTYFKNDSYSNSTLVHEITHQLMDEYLGFLPTWIIEGTAEYTEMLPYKSGTFRADAHKSGIKDDISIWEKQEGFQVDIGNLETHMTMTRDQWNEACSTPDRMRDMYHRSQLLVYYFSHLDGDKKGTRFIRFMDAVHGEVAAMRAFFADPRVKRMEGGRFSYPSDLTPPNMRGTAVFKHLPILLEERPYAKIASEIIEGYKSIGVKIQVQ